MQNVSPTQWKILREWWSTPLGQAFLERESLEVKETIAKLFGYHLLLLGEPQCIECVKGSLIGHRVWIHPNIVPRDDCSALASRQDKLSILSDSIDVVYLAHCLEFINNPHEALREIFRVLIPEGHVIISSFNPWSLWGLWRWIIRYFKRLPWDGRFITVTRLKDWLTLLGFDIVQVNHFFFRPPITHVGLLQRLKWLESMSHWAWPFLGGGYVLIARKRVITFTPIRSAFEKRRQMIPAGVVEPAARRE